MLKRLLKNEGLSFYHKREFDGKEYEAEFEIQIEKGVEKEIQISVDQLKGRNSAICLFNEEYDLDEDESFIQDLESQHLEFVIDKLEELAIMENLKEGKNLIAFSDRYTYMLSENDTPESQKFKLSISVEAMPPHKTVYFDNIEEIGSYIAGLEFSIDEE